MNINNRIEVNFEEIISSAKKYFSINKKPNIVLGHYPRSKFAGTSGDGTTIYLNDLYFSMENGKYYVNGENNELLIMRLTHEYMHVLSSNNGKTGIECGKNYSYNNIVGKDYKFDYNVALNEGITQMFTDEILDKTTNSFCDGYYHYKKIAQLLQYLFGSEVMSNSYFNNSGLLEKGMNKYCNNLYEEINKKLTLANYISSDILHSNINKSNNADLKMEKDICNSLKEESFNECLELIINNLIIPYFKSINSSNIKDETKKILEIFDDNITLKNRVMYFLMKGYKREQQLPVFNSSKNDVIVSHIINSNNSNDYEILDNGYIYDKKTNKLVPYNNQLYEYIYSKFINENDWKSIENNFNNYHFSNNKIIISLNNKTMKQRRMLMITLKQYMKKNNYVILNDIDYMDNGYKFEVNYINEKLTMEDIIYLSKNYTFNCLHGNTSNILQIVDKKTNRVLTSNSLIGKCKIAYKITSLGLSDTMYDSKWKEFTSVAEKQISSTGMIKKSSNYYNNPFLRLFNDGYGCEWFYDYMKNIPIEFDKVKQELYLKENEMNQKELQNARQNEELSLLFDTFIKNVSIENNKGIGKR